MPERSQGTGGKDLTDHHARHDEAHRPLRVLGQEEEEEPQHGGGADHLLQHLGEGGGAHQTGAVEGVLVEVFHTGEENAGGQQQQAQSGPGIPQDIDRDGVGEEDEGQGGQGQQAGQEHQAAPQNLLRRRLPTQGTVLGGEVGHRRRKADGGHREQHGKDRHDQLIKTHDLRPHQPGEEDPVDKTQKLIHKAGSGEQQGAVPHRRGVPLQGNTSLLGEVYSTACGNLPGPSPIVKKSRMLYNGIY